MGSCSDTFGFILWVSQALSTAIVIETGKLLAECHHRETREKLVVDNCFFNDLCPFCRCIKLYVPVGEVGCLPEVQTVFCHVFHVSFLFNKLRFICGLIVHILEAGH